MLQGVFEKGEYDTVLWEWGVETSNLRKNQSKLFFIPLTTGGSLWN